MSRHAVSHGTFSGCAGVSALRVDDVLPKTLPPERTDLEKRYRAFPDPSTHRLGVRAEPGCGLGHRQQRLTIVIEHLSSVSRHSCCSLTSHRHETAGICWETELDHTESCADSRRLALPLVTLRLPAYPMCRGRCHVPAPLLAHPIDAPLSVGIWITSPVRDRREGRRRHVLMHNPPSDGRIRRTRRTDIPVGDASLGANRNGCTSVMVWRSLPLEPRRPHLSPTLAIAQA